MRNGYGRSLRAKVIREFSVDDVVVLHDADCFEHEVSAYPAIVNICRSPQGPTNVAQAPLPDIIPTGISERLAGAFRVHDRDEANAAAAELYPTR